MTTFLPHAFLDSEFSVEVVPEEILAAIPNAVFATDKNMRIIYFNKTAEQITGFKKSEAIGMFCRDVIKSDLCESQCLIKQALDSGKSIFHVKTNITNAEGERLPVLVNTSLLRNKLGVIVGYLVIFQDISDLQRTMEELQHAKRMLVEKNRSLRLAYKELKLTQQHLVESQKMESLGRLAGGVAHHFNNILCGVLGYLELLKNRVQYDKVSQTYVAKMEKSTLKAAELIRKILAFAQGARTKIEKINLNRLIMDLATTLKETLDANIEINLDLDPNIYPIEGDPNQIYHALFNLCVNAQDAMPEGGQITIKTENKEILPHSLSAVRFSSNAQLEPGRYVVIAVSDTGMGIKPEIQDKVFDPFFTTKEPGQGTGLGLSMVHGIVKAHGGYIDLKSFPGRGTTFYLYFPAKELKI